MKRALPLALGLAALVGVVLWLYSSGRIGKSKAPSNVITLYGNVDIRQVELGFRVAGRLESMAFEEGQVVTAGRVMATLDARSYQDALQAAEAQVVALGATLKKFQVGARPAEVAKGRAAVQEATAAQVQAHIELDRTNKLVADNASPAANLDSALAASHEADARLESANQSYRLLVQGSRREDIDTALGTLQVAQAQVASSQTALDDTRLLAPSDGIVISRVHEPGAIVSPNDIVYVLSLTQTVWVRAYVSETQLGKVRPGLEVAVLSDSEPTRPLRGRVGFISSTSEFTPKSVETTDLRTDLVYRLRVIVEDPEQRLRQGMPVTIHIATAKR